MRCHARATVAYVALPGTVNQANSNSAEADDRTRNSEAAAREVGRPRVLVQTSRPQDKGDAGAVTYLGLWATRWFFRQRSVPLDREPWQHVLDERGHQMRHSLSGHQRLHSVVCGGSA